jgi:DNA-binding transcriptional LysR family regulator
MTLEQLKMLKQVAELGSLKSASAILFKTQPAISQGIKQLETQLGLQLFNREGYRLSLTLNGNKIYQHALRLLDEAEQINQLATFLKSGNEASITIAIEASYDLKKILPVLEMTQSEFPNTQIILKQEYINGALDAVRKEIADIAITTIDQSTLLSGKFEANNLYKGYLYNVAAPRFTARHSKLNSVTELKNEYQIVVQDSGQSSPSINYSVQTGQRCWYVNDFNTKKTLILSGMGWGRLPEYMIKSELEQHALSILTMADFDKKVALNYQAVKLKSRLLGPVAEQLWQNLKFVHEKI